MTHRTVAPTSQTYEIRLVLRTGDEKKLLATVRGTSPKNTRNLFATVERVLGGASASQIIAELYNNEQGYVYSAHVTDAATVERLTGRDYDELLVGAEPMPGTN